MRAFSGLAVAATLLASLFFGHTATATSFGAICTAGTLPVEPGDTPVNPGLLWNPHRSGTGWSIVYSQGMGAQGGPAASGVHLVWYTYRTDGTPIWYLSDPVAITTDSAGNSSFETMLFTYSWAASAPNAPRATKSSQPAGRIRGYFSPSDQSRLALQWQLNSLGSGYTSECLTDFSRELHPASLAGGAVLANMTSGVNMAFNGAYYDPLNSGWGMFQHVVRTNNLADESLYQETLALALYDDAGQPTWVLGVATGDAATSPPPLGTWHQIPLSLFLASPNFDPRTTCPAHNSSCSAVQHAAGTWRRNFLSTAEVRANVEVELSNGRVNLRQFDVGQPPLPGQSEPAASVTLRRLTRNNYIVVDRAPCVAYPGQSTCNVSINWSASPESNPVRVMRVESGPGANVTPQQVGWGDNGGLDVALDPLVFGVDGPRRLHFELHTNSGMVSRTPVLYARATTSDPLQNVSQPAYPTTEAQAAHTPGLTRLPGSASVSGGAATYSIPIDVPPGRRGMQPSVSLEYSSRSGNGIAGMGFSLSAGGSIHRCPMTLEQDGRVRAVALANDDRLCLNGQRLRRIEGGAYGSVEAVYATEIDSFVRVVQKGGGLSDAATYFEVRTKDGELQVYGAPSVLGGSGGLVRPQRLDPTPGLLAPLHWMLAERRDCVGNVERHIYTSTATTSSGTSVPEVLLSEIRYTGHRAVANPVNAGCAAPLGGTLTDGTRRVAFVYEARPDTSSSFVGGGVLWQTQRLVRIGTYAPDIAAAGAPILPVREFGLSYEKLLLPPIPGAPQSASTAFSLSESQSSGRSLLRSLTESGIAQGVGRTRTPTEFEWQDGELQVRSSRFRDAVPKLPADLHPVRIVGDFDGDGHRELLARRPDQSVVLVSLGADRGIRWQVDISRAFEASGGSDRALLDSFFHDVDLDGRVDLLVYEPVPVTEPGGPAPTRPTQRFEAVFYRLAVAPNATGTIDDLFPLSRRIRTGVDFADVRDLDGDGYPDLIVQTPSHSDCPDAGRRVDFVRNGYAKNPAQPFSEAPSRGFCLRGRSLPFSDTEQQIALISDINGDGVLDFALTYQHTDNVPPDLRGLWGYVRLGSLADGSYTVAPEVSFASFLGQASQGLGVWGDRPQPASLLTGDFNGDGLVDLAWAARPAGGTERVWVFRFGSGARTGSGFTTPYYSTSTDGLRHLLIAPNGEEAFINAGRIKVGDTNSDGKDEILVPNGFAQHLCTRNFIPPAASLTGSPANSFPVEAPAMCLSESSEYLPHLRHPAGEHPSCFTRRQDDPGSLLRRPGIPDGYYYSCPEHPVSGEDTVVRRGTEFGARFVDAPEGAGVLQWVVPMHHYGAHVDFSLYTYAALDLALAPGGVQASPLRSTQLVAGPNTLVFSEDLFSDGLPDSIYSSGCESPCEAVSRLDRSNVNPAVAGSVATFDPPSAPMNPAPRMSQSLGVGGELSLGAPTLPDLLSAVIEPVAGDLGSANIFEWRYSPLSGRAGRAAGSLPLYTLQPPEGDSGSYADDRHFYFTSSMPVVAEFSRPAGVKDSNGHELQNTTLYGYGQAMYHAFGRGFQGFRSIEEWDLTQGSALQTVFHQRFPLTSRIERQTVRALGVSGSAPVLRGPLSTTRNTWLCGLSNRSTCPDNGANWSGGFPFLDRSVVETFDATAAQAGTASSAISRKTVSHVPWVTLSADACPSLPGNGGAAGYDPFGNLLSKYELVEDLGSDARLSKACSLEQHEYLQANTNPAFWWVNRLDKTTQHRRVSYSAQHSVPSAVPASDLNPRQSRRSVYVWDNATRLLTQQTEQLVQDTSTDTLTTTTFRYPVALSPVSCAGMAGLTGINFGLPSCVSVARGTSTAGDAPEAGIDLVAASPQTRETRTAYSADGYFPAEVRNALGHTVSTITRPRDGQPASAIDANGLRTEIQYDAFGFAVRTRFPQRSGSLTRQPDIAVGLQGCGFVDCSGVPGAHYRQQTSALGAPTRMQYFDVLGREIASEVEVRAATGSIQGTRISRTGVFHNRRGLVEREAAPVGVGTFGAVVSGWPTAYTEYSGFDVLGRPALKRERGMNRASVAPTSTNLSERITAPDRATAYTYSGRNTSIRAYLVSGSTATDERTCCAPNSNRTLCEIVYRPI